jgi:hypothetical protein
MNAIEKVFTRSTPEARSDVEDDSFATVAPFCLIGLLASFCMAIYGPDLSLGLSLGFF